MGELIPIVAMLLVLGPPAAFIFSWTPIGRAITQRLKGQSAEDSGQLEEMHRLLEDVHDAIERVSTDVEDLRDRVSFAERLLASGIEKADRMATPA